AILDREIHQDDGGCEQQRGRDDHPVVDAETAGVDFLDRGRLGGGDAGARRGARDLGDFLACHGGVLLGNQLPRLPPTRARLVAAASPAWIFSPTARSTRAKQNSWPGS